MTPTPPRRMLRRSALEAMACPHRYKKLYVDEVDDTSDEALRGQVAHDVAKVYIRRLVSLNRAHDEEATRATIAGQPPVPPLNLRGDAEEAKRALEATLAVTKLPPHLVQEVEMLVMRWSQRFELDIGAYLLAEETQAVASERLEWTPDLVYVRGHEIEQVDWKTFWVGFTENQVKQQFQAKVYVWLAAKAWPNFPQYRFTFDFMRLGYQVTAVWYPDEIAELDLEIRARVRAIEDSEERDEWPAIPGEHCGFCRLKCPMIDQVDLMPRRVTSGETAQAVAGELLVLEQAVAARKKALKGYCKTEGPVDVGGARYGFKGSVKRKFLIRDVLKVLEEHEIQPHFKIGSTPLSSYLKAQMHAGVRPDLEDIAEVTPRQTFTSWKPSEQEPDHP